VRWRRLASAFPRWTTALLGFIALQCLCWWAWFAWELRPLERYYLTAYFDSTEEAARRPGARTRIDPLFKAAPGKKRELVLASEVVSGGDENLPLQLSQSALERGWMGIEKGPPIWDDCAAVEDILRDDFYQSRGFWQVAAEPLLYSGAFLLASIISAFFVRKELRAEWRDLWAAFEESQSPLDYRIDSPANRIRIMTRIGLRWEAPKADREEAVETPQSQASNEPLYRCEPGSNQPFQRRFETTSRRRFARRFRALSAS